MKRHSLTTALLLLMVITPGCRNESLVGKWERIGDASGGTVIQVERVGTSYQGKLLVVSGELSMGFKVGEIKWKDLEKVDDARWEGLDLTKVFLLGQGYGNASFSLYDSGRLLKIEWFQGRDEPGGVQKWKRVD